MSGKDTNVEPQKGGDDPINYHAPDLSSSNWQGNGNNLTNTSLGMIPIGSSIVESSVCSSAPTVDSFCPPIWDNPINGQNLSYCDVNLQSGASTSSSLGLVRPDMGWTLNGMLREGMFLPNVSGMVPQSLPHFPADSDFIERAARFSCFSGGSFGDMMNPFGILDPLNLYSRAQEAFGGNGLKPNTMDASREASLPGKHSSEGSPFKNEKKADHGVEGSGNESNEAEFSGRGGGDELEGATEESFGKGLDSKKRKRNGQDTGYDENNEAPQLSSGIAKNTMEMKQKGDQNPSSVPKPGAKNGKQGPQESDPPKEEYIHMRARRGQATNSHSLAERVRREKISERMKFLQDLVPGCSKVTGKAVMLDEIINYVQSLQRQVEFLSMKLATVNPRLDFNIEGLLAKDILQPRTGLPFPPDMTMPLPSLHSSQPGQFQAGHLEALRRPMNFQATAATGGFKDPTSRVPSVWEDELHNIVHMGFNSSAPLGSQDLSGSLPPGHMKAEP